MAVNPLLSILAGVGQGFAADQKQRQDEEYKKALVEHIKTQAKLEEQKIGLMSQKEVMEQYRFGEGQKLAASAINQTPYQPGPMPQAPAMPMQGQPMAAPEQPQRQGLIPKIVNLMQGNPQKYESMPGVPYGVADVIHSVAQKEGIPPQLLASMIKAESNFNPGAVSPKGAQGLMQLMPNTAQGLGVQNPMDPAQNVAGGARFLKSLLQKYNNNLPMALAAYNWGPGNVDKHGLQNMPVETRNFIASVMGGVRQNTQMAQNAGVEYKYGAKDTSSGTVDCSGWVCETLNKAGVPISGSAAQMAEQAQKMNALVPVTAQTAQPGMLVFKSTPGAAKEGRFGGIGHVGMTIEKDNRVYVSESTSGKGVTFTPIEQYVGGREGVYAAPIGAFANQQPQQTQPGPGTAPGRRPLLSQRDQMRMGMKMMGLPDVGEGKGIVYKDMGDHIAGFDEDGNIIGKYLKTPGTHFQQYSDKEGNKFQLPFTVPSPGRPSEPLGAPAMIEPGPMQSKVPMTAKDREEITEWQDGIRSLNDLEKFAQNPALFGPKMDIYTDLLTGKGITSKIAQSYAGPQEDLIVFRNLLEKFNADIRSKRYGAALSEQEAQNYYREALNARNPQEFLAVLKKVRSKLGSKLESRVKVLQGTQGDYLNGLQEDLRNNQGQLQQPVIRYERNPQTGRLERVQ